MSVKSGFSATFGVVIALLVIGLAVPILFCGFCGIGMLGFGTAARDVARQADQRAVKRADDEAPQAKTAKPEDILPPPPAKIALPAKTGAIPGFMPVDLYGNLLPKGFTKKMDQFGNITEFRIEEKVDAYQHLVVMRGRSPSSVDHINATTLSFVGDPDETARDFLAYVATVPYEGSKPAEAQEWVRQNVGVEPKVKEIGGVIFRLHGVAKPGTARILQIATRELQGEAGLLLDVEDPAAGGPAKAQAAPQGEPEASPEQTAEADAMKREKSARAKLNLARQFSDKAKRKKWLGEIVRDFEGTEAATEAQAELDKWAK